MTYVAPRFQHLIRPWTKDQQGKSLLGAWIGMPDPYYHSIEAFSQSYAKEFAKSPAHGHAYSMREWEADPKREMYKAVHLLTLEPEEHNRIVVKDGRWAGALKDEVEALQAQGYIVLKKDGFDTARAMAQSILAHPRAAQRLKNSIPELSIFWEEETEAGPVLCKARCDAVTFGDAGIDLDDLKSFGSLHDETLLGAHAYKSKYHVQMGYYAFGLAKIFEENLVSCGWIFCEDDAPYGVKVRGCSPQVATAGWRDISALLGRYRVCTMTNEWPSYDDQESVDLVIPSYLARFEE